MFVGRESELHSLERAYAKGGFQMAVIYGRRRVGKTTLIDEFVRDKPTLYFTAQQKTTRQNLELFSAAAYEAFSLPASLPAFATWNDALSFIVEKVRSWEGPRPLVFVFDEFPYAAESDPRLTMALRRRMPCSSCAGATRDSWRARSLGARAHSMAAGPCS